MSVGKPNLINIDKIFNFDNFFDTEIERHNYASKPKSKVASFRNHWTGIVDACSPLSIDLEVSDTNILNHMDRMKAMLISEDRNIPNNLASCGECMEYFLNKECLRQLVQSSIKGTPPHGLIYATIDFYSDLCSLMNENFLTKKAVYKPLLILLKHCYTNKDITQRYEKYIIDLLFNICQKINIHPQLLNIFIYENSEYYECILFEYLKQFILTPGNTGDMARTSMKYLFVHSFEIFSNYIKFINFPEQLIDNLCMAFNELPMDIKEVNNNNYKIYQFTTLFTLTESIIMDCSMQNIRDSIMFNLKEKFLKKIFMNKYIECYKSSENLDVISSYFYYMLSKIICIDFSSCFVSFIFQPFTFVNKDQSNSQEDESTNLFQLIMDNIMSHERNTSLDTINMLIITCLLKQHYRYTISYLIPNIRTKINSDKNDLINTNNNDNKNEINLNSDTDKINEVNNNSMKDKAQLLRNEVNRYIELFNSIKKDFGNEELNISDQYQEYIFDTNTNSSIQLSGLNFNDLNKNYPENAIQNILEEPDTLKAIKLLDNEAIFSQLFTLLKSFFENSPEFNLALTDAISQLLAAPETYLFIYLIDRDILDKNNKDSLYTIFTDLIKKRKQLLNSYQNELLKLNDGTSEENQQLIISNFNRNSRFILEFIKEVTVTIFEIQLKSEVFENYS